MVSVGNETPRPDGDGCSHPRICNSIKKEACHTGRARTLAGKGVKADENSARGRLCCQKAQSPELTATGIALAPPRRGRTVVFRVASDNIKTAPSPHAAKDGGIE